MMTTQGDSDWTTMMLGDLEVRYQLHEPAPDQWNAVGLVRTTGMPTIYSGNCPMIVGRGESANDAVVDLIASILNRRGVRSTIRPLASDFRNPVYSAGFSRPPANVV